MYDRSWYAFILLYKSLVRKTERTKLRPILIGKNNWVDGGVDTFIFLELDQEIAGFEIK